MAKDQSAATDMDRLIERCFNELPSGKPVVTSHDCARVFGIGSDSFRVYCRKYCVHDTASQDHYRFNLEDEKDRKALRTIFEQILMFGRKLPKHLQGMR